MTNQKTQENPIENQMLDKEEIVAWFDKTDRAIKELNKKHQSIQVSLDAIYEDRDLLTDLMNEIEKVKALILASDKKNENLSKEIEFTVEKRATEVQIEVQHSTSTIKNTIVQRVIRGMQRTFAIDNVTVNPRPWYQRFFFKMKAPLTSL